MYQNCSLILAGTCKMRYIRDPSIFWTCMHCNFAKGKNIKSMKRIQMWVQLWENNDPNGEVKKPL